MKRKFLYNWFKHICFLIFFSGLHGIEPVAAENQPHMHIFVKVLKKFHERPPGVYAVSKSIY